MTTPSQVISAQVISPQKDHALRLAVDIGGTFTDTVLAGPVLADTMLAGGEGMIASTKTLTTHKNPADGALEGSLRVMESSGHHLSEVKGFIHGTTLATNALIERRGAVVATLCTAGFRDILDIGYERRYAQYDINLEKPDLLVPRERSFVIRERISAEGEVLVALDEQAIDGLLVEIDESGAEALAICLLHSYANPTHEQRLREVITRKRPRLVVSISCEVSPEAREFDRLCTVVANAYIQPLMENYLERFVAQFREEGLNCPILMMTAGGGMCTVETARRFPIRLVESGPAGGAILAAKIAADLKQDRGIDEVLSFDVGGTTAKLCLIDQARPQTSRSFEIARAARFIKGSGMPVRIPVIDMIEIGAGGGSIADVDHLGRLAVGPQSAGSEPGPVAFMRGGSRATVTDSDIALGYIVPDIFAEGHIQLDPEAARQILAEKIGGKLGLDARQAADGVSRIVDENMASAGRMHAVESGKDLGSRAMIAFGGNGPLHATRVARSAGINHIIVPPDPGVGSAVGFLFAPVSFDIVRSRYALLAQLDLRAINRLFEEMIGEARDIVAQGSNHTSDIATETRRTAFMRYRGQGHEIAINLPDRPLIKEDIQSLTAAFEAEYRRQFSRPVPGMQIEVLNWAVRVATQEKAPSPPPPARPVRSDFRAKTSRTIICDLEGIEKEAAFIARADLKPGDYLAGPALIHEPQTTTLVSADFSAEMDALGNLVLTRIGQEPKRSRMIAENHPQKTSPARLQVMWNRLLAVVEEQGQTLIRAAFSPIVRECGDISAGIFDVKGRMLAQAVTGTPGHINTMAEAVLHLCKRFALQDMKPGDIYMTNDPWLASGHLNDFLLMMPVFRAEVIIGFTACTSHLVDLGGLGMGPEGSDIYDEGLLIPPCKLVEEGTPNALLLDIIRANSREPIANEGDIYALIACCESGARRLLTMMDDFALADLSMLGDYIIETSRKGAIDAIAAVPPGVYKNILKMDGYENELTLQATLTVTRDAMHVDFTGTSGLSKKGINVPLNYATAYSVFALRCLVGPDIPNNAGSLAPFTVDGPENCILNARPPAPVAMRHTLGQVTPDLILGCLHQALPDKVPAEGASCMFDLPMRHAPEVTAQGGREFAIEPVHNGGTGARPHADGLSATAYPSGVFGSQVEITESVAPVVMWRRELLPDSGGPGTYRGGLGQRIEMTSANDAPFIVFLSVERLKFPAQGRMGGLPGAPGRIRFRDGKRDIPGKGELRVAPGDYLIFDTPGGGGFGPPDQRDRDKLRLDLVRGLVTKKGAMAYGKAK